MSTMYETDEEIKETEARRQALASSIAFQNLGEPVQKLLFALNAEISEDELSLLSTITVLQLAKVFDMMSSGEDPEKILAWLRRTARRNAQGEDPYQNERKRKVYTGASRDPISFYKEIERRNIELQERHRKAAEEREKIRLANLARREEERRKRAERLEEEQRIAQENGENTTALERLKEKDRSDLTNTFERFVNKQSTYDNSAKAQDGEWWKKEEHRRDYEKLGKKGKKWKAVQENGNIQAPEPELAIREDWYKSQTWWKGDKYRNDWYKTRDVAWWKETPYIRDWQENGAKGTMWTAADESSGFNCKGREHAAELSELEKRIEWYKVNGPKGVQTLWSAMAEGSIDRCTVDEKHERVDYYKNGDWWRCDDEYRRFNQPDSSHEPLKVPGPSGADREWWKSDKYRADFENKGELWKCANEVAIVQGKSKDFPATESEQERRAQWYRDNWWKAPRYMDDYEKNGQNGFLWRSRTESDAKGGAPKLCKDSEAFLRQIWYDSHERRVWWKDNEYQRDYEMHGDKGEKWTAACEELAILSRASEHPASEQERKRREDWYKQNWWKADRYSHDYLENINGVLWKGTDRTATIDIDWWKQPLYRADFMAHNAPAADVAFWQAPEVIEDFQKHGGSGKMWCAVDAFAAASHTGDKQPASAEEIAKRKEWYGRYWWRGLRYQREWAVKGMKGSLWLSGEEPLLGSRGGTVAPPEELRLRQEAYAMHGTLWRALTETEAHTGSKNLCQPRVALERMLWYRANWWKSEEMLKDFEANGKRWKSVTQEDTTGQHEVGEEERKLREKWFALCSDMFFWQQPEYIDDYFRKGKEGALWCAKNAVDARRALGRERPASTAELQEREEWYKKNHWKSLSSIEKFVQSGSTEWQCTTHGSSDKVSGAELDHRKMWLTAHAPCNEQEQNQRKNYHRSQLTDLEVGHRFAWLDNKGKENKRISKDELNDLLQMLNQNQPATPEQIAAVEAKIQEFRTKGLSTESPDGSMSQEEIINAVAETGFYVPPTDQELQMNEEEIFEELEKEEAARLEEEAAFLAMEAEEERKQAGGEPEQDDINDEEAAFLAQQEAEKAPHVNEDDLPMSDEQIKAWEKFNEDPTPADSDKNEELAAQREAERAEEERRRKAEEEAWKQEAVPDDEPEEEGAEETTLDAAVKEDLEEQVNEDENAQWREDDDDDEKEDAESVAESATPDVPATSPQDPKPEPPEKSQQWKLPLPQVTNPQFLKAYFMVIKYVPKGALVSGKQKRVWVVDHFTRSFYNMDTDGTIRKEHAAHKLLQLEKSTVDLRRVRMMFLDASHSYELLFPNAIERERFYETASAIRPSIRVFAPSLTNPDASVECTSTTIDGVGPNTVVVQVPTLKGNIVDRELTGECKINASRSITEAVSVWVGTLNLSDATPPKDAGALEPWMPRGKYDVYAVGIQEGSYQKEDNEWFNYVQKHLGKDYLTLATMRLWDIYLIVLARKKNLLRITNVEGSTKATSHKSVCGTKGGVGICLRIHDTSLCFVTCQLAARPERTAMRNTNIQEIIDSLQLSLADVEFTQQFNHVFFFGDFNYRVELENDVAEKKIQAQDYAAFVENCQLNQQCRKEGLLHGFMEPPVNFRPTYRFKKGTLEYNMTQGMIPSYTDRVLIKSMPNAAISCTSYGACEKLLIGEHLPVSATFTIRALRPCISCFETVQKPKVRFTFRSVSVTEYTGVPFTKAQMTMHTNFSEGPHVTKPFGSGDELHPSWAEKDIPPINSVNHLAHYLELQHILIVLRDASEKNPIKAARGSACLPLAGAVLNKQGVPQGFPIDIRVHGKRVGTLKVELTWVPG